MPDDFEFELDDHLHEAKKLLRDARVSTVRYALVPSMFTETEFWRRLFYFVSLAMTDIRTPTVLSRSSDEHPDSQFADKGRGSPEYDSRPIGMGIDFTPRGTAVGAYDDFHMTPRPD